MRSSATAMPRTPPSFVVRPHDVPARRRWQAAIGAAWLVSLVLVAVLAAWYEARRSGESSAASASSLAAQKQGLETRLAILTRAAQVDKAALADLQQTLRDREEEIDGLRSDLSFYGRLVGGPSRQGLRVHDLRLQPVAKSRAWNFAVTLTQTFRQGAEAKGRLLVSVDGVQHGKLASLPWAALSQGGNPDGLQYDFKYFQRVQGTIMLPDGFDANRVHVVANGDGGKVERDFPWTDVARREEGSDVRS